MKMMKYGERVVCLLILMAPWAMAQQNASQTPAASQPAFDYKPTADEAELIRLSQEWMDAALVKPDGKRLEELMAPEYNLQAFDASRAPQPRAAWLALLKNGLKVHDFRYTSINAKVFGDVGIVYSTFRWSGQLRGVEFQDAGVLVDVWQRRKGKWQVVSRRSAGQSLLGKLTKSEEKKPAETKER